MNARTIYLRIGHLVVENDGSLSAADLESAIGQAINQRLEAAPLVGRRGSLPETIADGVLDHPRVSAHLPRGGS